MFYRCLQQSGQSSQNHHCLGLNGADGPRWSHDMCFIGLPSYTFTAFTAGLSRFHVQVHAGELLQAPVPQGDVNGLTNSQASP